MSNSEPFKAAEARRGLAMNTRRTSLRQRLTIQRIGEALFADVLQAIGEHHEDAVFAATYMCNEEPYRAHVPFSISRDACMFLRDLAAVTRTRRIDEDLRPYFGRVIGSSRANESRHRYQIIDRLYREACAAWAEAAGLLRSIKAFRNLPPITDRRSASEARKVAWGPAMAEWGDVRREYTEDEYRLGEQTRSDEWRKRAWDGRSGLGASLLPASPFGCTATLFCGFAADVAVLRSGRAGFDAAISDCSRTATALLGRLFNS